MDPIHGKQTRKQQNLKHTKVAVPPTDAPRDARAAEARLAIGLAHHKSNRLRQAVTVYRQVLGAQPDHPEALHLLGVVMHQMGKNSDAAELIGKAVALDPNHAKAHANLGVALAACRKLDAAVAAYRKAIALDPGHAAAHFNLGVALAQLGKLDEAVDAYRTAVALKPNYAEAHTNLGTALKDQGRLDEAVASYQRAVAFKPDLAESNNNLGVALQEQGNLAEAVASFQRAIALKPDHSETHFNLGIALNGQGKIDEAVASYQRAMAIKPDYVEARFNHAIVHRFVPGDPEIGTLKMLSGRTDLSEDQKNQMLFALGKAHDDIGHYAEAFSYYSSANEGKARRVTFDPSRRRRKTLAVKEAFRARSGALVRDTGEAAYTPVFVVGMSRSGKTLVESLLSRHDDVYAGKESEEWSNAMKAVLANHMIAEPYPKCIDCLSDNQIKEIGTTYLERITRNSPSSRIFINTLPGNYWYIGIILRALPETKIIYCHRDPVDNCLFVYFRRYSKGHQYSYDLANIASYYANYQDMMAHWRRLYKDRILTARYEDLVRNPGDTGAQIFEFCGLDPMAVEVALTTDEIGHWKHYAPYLESLRQALGGVAPSSNIDHGSGD